MESQIDTTVASGALNEMVSSFKDYLIQALPALLVALGLALVAVLLWKSRDFVRDFLRQ